MHHDFKFSTASDEDIIASVKALEKRCEDYKIPKPVTIGYPLGDVWPDSEKLLHDRGYLWGRGSMIDCSPRVAGDSWYDPYGDSPLVVPNIHANTKEMLIAAFNGAVKKKPFC